MPPPLESMREQEEQIHYHDARAVSPHKNGFSGGAVAPSLGGLRNKPLSDEEWCSSSVKNQENQIKSDTLVDNNKKINFAEFMDMSPFKLIYKEMVAIYMSRIGSALMWWFIATLVVALGLTLLT